MVSSELLEEYGFEEEIEEVPGSGASYSKTGFPDPLKRYKIVWEVHNLNLEDPYYWLHKFISRDLGYSDIVKTEDAFGAAETSAFFGDAQQKLGTQQQNLQNYLATIGKLTKELFSMVKEIRVIDQRREYYEGSEEEREKPQEERDKSDEIALKGVFVDQVQGGAKNPASIYGMAQELQFTSLPDLFFDAPPLEPEEVEDYVNSLDFNRKVKEVLTRHLKEFSVWRDKTYEEHKNRRKFMLQYLRQHFEVIRMYMTWVKPYLRNVRRLTMKDDYASDPEVVSSFDSGMIDVEWLARRDLGGDYKPVILTTFNFRSKPQMSYQQGRSRGPLHMGKLELNLRGYAWTDEEFQDYVDMKEAENFELMRRISGSIESAMDALGDDFTEYLKEAEESWDDEEKSKPKHQDEDDDFFRRMFFDFVGPKKPEKNGKKENNVKESLSGKGEAEGDVRGSLNAAYETFKKSHGMVHW